jgi:colanic acid biosynthesis glycosyl transferase WcaI
MRILMVGINFWPEPTGIGKYSGELAEYLCKAGHQVTVITAPPYYPYWQVQRPYHERRYQRETWNGVTVIRCPLYVPKKVTSLRRVAHLFSFALSALPEILREKSKHPDLIFSVEPALFASALVASSDRMGRTHTWLHIQDFELDAALNLGMLKRIPFIEKVARSWESRVYRRFGTISTISHAMINRLIEKQVDEEKIQFFPNWIDTKLVHPLSGENCYRKELQLSAEDTVVLYSGSIGQKQGIETLIESVKSISAHKGIHLVICGEGPGKPKLKEAANGFSNIHFLSVQPAGSLNELLNMADIHVLPQKAGAADLVMPSKLLGMLASGRSVIASCQEGSELYEIVKNIGLTALPENPADLADKILTLESDKALRQELGTRGREYAVEHFSSESVLGAVNSVFLNL